MLKTGEFFDARTYGELLRCGTGYLEKREIKEASVDSFLLLSYLTGWNRAEFFLNQDEVVPDDVRNRFMEWLETRGNHVPLQYLTGEQEFMGLSFLVNEHVLIPRQDTEILVETVLPFVSGKTVLDMCTGSGCIAVSLAVLGKTESVCASDISKQAIAVAKRNAQRHRAAISFFQGDLFEPVSGIFDVIVSNPPYISSDEMSSLMEEVGKNEPESALEGGADGLDFYRKITKESKKYLKKKGMLFYEIGCNQREAVMAVMNQYGFAGVSYKKDYAGHDRVVYGTVE